MKGKIVLVNGSVQSASELQKQLGAEPTDLEKAKSYIKKVKKKVSDMADELKKSEDGLENLQKSIKEIELEDHTILMNHGRALPVGTQVVKGSQTFIKSETTEGRKWGLMVDEDDVIDPVASD